MKALQISACTVTKDVFCSVHCSIEILLKAVVTETDEYMEEQIQETG